MTGSGNYQLSDKIKYRVFARREGTFHLPSSHGSKNSKYFSILPLDLKMPSQFVGVLLPFMHRRRGGGQGGDSCPSSIFYRHECFFGYLIEEGRIRKYKHFLHDYFGGANTEKTKLPRSYKSTPSS